MTWRGTSPERHPWFANPGTPSPEEQALMDAAAVPYPVPDPTIPVNPLLHGVDPMEILIDEGLEAL